MIYVSIPLFNYHESIENTNNLLLIIENKKYSISF